MTVQVLYFGVLKEFFTGERELFELPEGARVSALLDVLRVRSVAEIAVWGSLAVAVNREYAGRETELKDGDEVALLPPVSGGCGETVPGGSVTPMSPKRDMGHPVFRRSSVDVQEGARED